MQLDILKSLESFYRDHICLYYDPVKPTTLGGDVINLPSRQAQSGNLQPSWIPQERVEHKAIRAEHTETPNQAVETMSGC